MADKRDDFWRRYRLSENGAQIAAEGWASKAFELQEVAPERGLRGWWRRTSKVELAVATVSLAGVALAMWLFAVGGRAHLVGVFALAATAPLTLVVWVLVRSDRLAPVGRWYVLMAVLWGGGVATLVAGAVNSALQLDFTLAWGDLQKADVLTAVAVAPVVEEVCKGAGVALILLLLGKRVVSVTNGLCIGGVCGAGFAFVENIQYFIEAKSAGTAVLGFTMFARMVLSPFIHPMATSLTGAMFVGAMLRRSGPWGWTWRVVTGFSLAIATHALWNALATNAQWWGVGYLLIEVPLFVSWMLWARKRSYLASQRAWQGLQSYIASGWVSPAEAASVVVKERRSAALTWAKKAGPPAPKVMRDFLRAGGRLGVDQWNMERTGSDSERVVLAQQSLAALLKSRGEIARIVQTDSIS